MPNFVHLWLGDKLWSPPAPTTSQIMTVLTASLRDKGEGSQYFLCCTWMLLLLFVRNHNGKHVSVNKGEIVARLSIWGANGVIGLIGNNLQVDFCAPHFSSYSPLHSPELERWESKYWRSSSCDHQELFSRARVVLADLPSTILSSPGRMSRILWTYWSISLQYTPIQRFFYRPISPKWILQTFQ